MSDGLKYVRFGDVTVDLSYLDRYQRLDRPMTFSRVGKCEFGSLRG